MECQRSVNNFQSCIMDNPSAVQLHQPFIKLLATFMGKNASNDIATTS